MRRRVPPMLGVLVLSVAAALLAPACSCADGHGPLRPRDGGADALGCPDLDLDGVCDPQVDADLPDIGTTGFPDAARDDTGMPDLADGSMFDIDTGTVVAELCPASAIIPSGCLAPVDEVVAGLCNQLDDDCDGSVDEHCGCTPGSVQSCFAGPPGRRGVGGCADGTQQCMGTEFGTWGPCEGGILPGTEVCNGLDDDCNGCRDEVTGCTPLGMCPGPGDPRVPDGAPFVDYPLRGTDFFMGSGAFWSWTVEGGPCDRILPRPTYTVTGASMPTATFHPTLSGDYTVTLTVTDSDGNVFTCTWIVHVRGPGLRVEMCYPEASTQDLDLFLSQPGFAGNWYIDFDDAFQPAREVCGWHDCEANIRGTLPGGGGMYPRASWGYATSPLSECRGGPLGASWAIMGACANPRLDIDNNLSEGIGVPENINVDVPREGDRFRVMVQNWTGSMAEPVVNIYCGGRRTATIGDAPDTLPRFVGIAGYSGIGAMWRVADITTHVDAAGDTTCDVELLHPPGTTSGYYVTNDTPTF